MYQFVCWRVGLGGCGCLCVQLTALKRLMESELIKFERCSKGADVLDCRSQAILVSQRALAFIREVR